jgi:low temperature requirement protein LtrA
MLIVPSKVPIQAKHGDVRSACRPTAGGLHRKAAQTGRISCVTEAALPNLMRHRAEGHERVTNIELFFDLVYVFAVTQLSHHLLPHPTVDRALQAALLLAMVWLLWAYTTWVTNWLDPERIPVRLLLLCLMLIALVMSAALPRAFGDSGLLIGLAYAVAQIGRSLFAVWALRGRPLVRNFQRILAWCCVSGVLAVVGGLTATPYPRALFWLLAAGTDVVGGLVGFYTPRLGRSTTLEWDIEGGHFAERCQAFILIALGESIVVIGATFAGLLGPLSRQDADRAPTITAFVLAFVGSAALWWLYFDRSADEGARLIAESDDPGRLGRTAYHLIHPIMVAGIIVVAAADELVLARPDAVGAGSTSWLILGGAGLYIGGHLLFKLTVWGRLSWSRVAALVVIALLGLVAPHVSALALEACTTAVIVAVAVADHLWYRAHGDEESAESDAEPRQ